MPGSYRVFNSIDEVDLGDWERVRAASDSSIFMDPRFLAAIEISMKATYQFWYVIGYDAHNHPAACAALCGMTIDVADLAEPRLASIIRRVPKALTRLRGLKALFCGLPGSPGEKNLALTSPDAGPSGLQLLDQAVCDLAVRAGMDVTVYKEFGERDLAWMDALLGHGYRRIPTQPMYFFAPSFIDFAQYCASLSSRYRSSINRSMRKLKSGGVELSIVTDPEDIRRVYTAEVHALHEQMVARAEMNIEVLPIEFFRQLASRLDRKVELIALSRDSRIIAMGWCLHDDSSYHMLYAGLDYRLNPEFDLYFNLMYATLDRALQKRVAKIHVGQTADVFKARLGCRGQPLYAFVKGHGPVMSRLVRYGTRLVLAPTPATPPSDIFRKEGHS
jgi:predicted N-acyltransferase